MTKHTTASLEIEKFAPMLDIIDIDRSDLMTEEDELTALMAKNSRTLIAKWGGIPAFLFLLLSLISGSLGLLLASVALGAITFLAVIDTPSPYFKCEDTLALFRQKKQELLATKIRLFEARTDGIAAMTPYIRTDSINNERAAKWLQVLKESANNETISDVDTYLEVFEQVKHIVNKEHVHNERIRLESELRVIKPRRHAGSGG